MSGLVFRRDGFGPKLDEFAFVPPSTIGHLARRLPEGTDAFQVLCDSWQCAHESGLVVDEGRSVSFPVWTPSADAAAGSALHEDDPSPSASSAELPDNDLVATLVPNNRDDVSVPWALRYVGPDRYRILDKLRDDLSTPRDIQSFAWMPWDRVLEEVASAALDEPWDLGTGDRWVLRSYLRYTYQRAAIQGKVLLDNSNDLAAFNTGLVGKTFEDLFMCFKPNVRMNPEWEYAGVCVAGVRSLGKQLIEGFPQLPARASYFDDVTDLVFDSSQDLYVDTTHIVVDNVDRLPRAFLEEQLHDRPALLEHLARLGDVDDGVQREDFGEIRQGIAGDDALLRRLKDRLDDAIKFARKQTEWNYRAAVPCYHPKANEMSLLLPLCLQRPGHVDVALVVRLTASGSYQGETVLSMRQAYLDARLIFRPEESWLRLD